MNENTPLISVVMITYQHEKYIAEATQSILDQTFENFELIIVNDGSTDRTEEIIKSFQDSRIKYIYQENQGPSAAANNGILASSGKYIAVMSGDDVCYPQRLEIQYEYLQKSGHKIVFSWVDFIDDDSRIFVGKHFADEFFNHPNRTRAEMLNWFFMKGNYLCAVTAMVEAKVLLECGLFNLASIQLQDFEMWIEIVKKYDISLIEDKLVKYRIRSDSSNLSSAQNSNRSVFEHYQLQKKMLDNVPLDLFKLSFCSSIDYLNFQEGCEYELAKAFLYLKHDFILFKNIGVEKIFNLLQDKKNLLISKSQYNFGLSELHNLTRGTDITNSKTQAQLQETQTQLHGTQTQLQETHTQLHHCQEKVILMEASKFEKLRKIWVRMKKRIGLT
jgi:glycosyltransferase involved in cell wall biosynthesis